LQGKDKTQQTGRCQPGQRGNTGFHAHRQQFASSKRSRNEIDVICQAGLARAGDLAVAGAKTNNKARREMTPFHVSVVVKRTTWLQKPQR